MKPLALQADAEEATADLLATLIDTDTAVGPPPGEWNVSSSDPYVGVFWDGTPRSTPFISQHATIRVTAFAGDTGTAKDIARNAQARLLAHRGSPSVTAVQHLTGLLTGFDEDLEAEMASFTVRVTTRTTAL